MKKINVLGICLKDYTLKEALKNVDQYMQGRAVNTIAYISSKLLMAADGNDDWKTWIEAVDMTIFTETDILCIEGGISKNRVREIEENAFLIEFLKKAACENRSIYLLSDTQEKLTKLQENICRLQENLLIEDAAVLEFMESADMLINEINDWAPDIIISNLPSPRQERLMYEDKMKINARVWLALSEESMDGIGHQSIWRRLLRRIETKTFRKIAEKYHNDVK